MSSHGDISTDLSAYLDGELTPEAAGRVDRAVTASAEVSTRLHDLRRLRTILRAFDPVRPGADFVARVIAEARRRGLMRRVVRERMIGGALRLASAAAAVMLIATVVGIAYQSYLHRGPAGEGRANKAPVVAAAERTDSAPPAKVSDEYTGGLRAKWSGASSAGNQDIWHSTGTASLHKLDLAVPDVGAGAKEVAAALTELGLAKADFRDTHSLGAWAFSLGEPSPPGVTMPAKARAAPAPRPKDVPDRSVEGDVISKIGPLDTERTKSEAKLGPGQGEQAGQAGFVRIPAEPDEVRFAVVAPPRRIEALRRRLGHLRGLGAGDMGICDSCFTAPSTRSGYRTRAPEAAAPATAKAGTADASTTRPGEEKDQRWLAARLQRIGNGQIESDLTGAGESPHIEGIEPQAQPAAADPVAGVQQPAPAQTDGPVAGPTPRNEVLIITIRRRPADNQADPGRNSSIP